MIESDEIMVSLADVARMLGITFNSAKNRVLTGNLIADVMIPNNRGKGQIYRFKKSRIEEMINSNQPQTMKGANNNRFERLEKRIEELEKLVKGSK